MRKLRSLFTLPLLLAINVPAHAQSFSSLFRKTEELRARQRATEALEQLETDAQGAQEYFAMKRRIPGTKEVPVERYITARQAAQKLPLHNSNGDGPNKKPTSKFSAGAEFSAGLSGWNFLGPTNVPGRSRALVFAPDNPNIMYTAGVAGGVWKSTDHGQNWFPVGDAMTNIAVTTLAIAPGNSNIIYAGTGEGFGNFDAVRGLGLFKSTDAGATWTRLNFGEPYINKILVSPKNNNIVYVGTNGGFYRSTDGGASFFSSYFGHITDMALRTDQNTDVLFIADSANPRSNILRSKDATAFALTFDGALTSTYNYDFGRISLAIAPSSQNVVYALVESRNSARDGSLQAVYRSDSGGDLGTWNVTADFSSPNKLNRLLLSNVLAAYASNCVPGESDFLYGQGWYDNVITVDPRNAERVWVGGTDLFRSDDGGKNWGIATYWWAQGSSSYAHADQHSIVFDPQYDGTSNQQLWVTNDGGVFRSDNANAATSNSPCLPSSGRISWQSSSNGLATTQFYGGAVFPSGTTYFGGTQDNGTVSGTESSGPNNWAHLLGGDGGYTAVDPINPQVLYAAHPYLDIQKSFDGGSNWTSISRSIDDYGLFVTPFELDPTNNQRLWTGGFYMWRSDNAGATWSRAGVLTPGEGFVSAIASSPLNPNNVVAGMSDGYMVSTRSGTTNRADTVWSYTRPREGFVSSIAFDPTDPNTIYVTYSSFASYFSDKHIFKSVDLGSTWSPLDGSGDYQLPDVPVHSLVVDPISPTHLYVGTDIGVFVSLDGGLNWNQENTGFLNAITESLVMQRNGATATLYGFTHGRGVYSTQLRELSILVSPTVLDFKTYPVGQTTPPLQVTVRNPGTASVQITNIQISQNFTITSSDCGALGAGASCTIGVTATPPGSGKFTGELTITHDGSNSPYTVGLRGQGVLGAFIRVDWTSLDFGNVEGGTASPIQAVTLTNIGSETPYGLSYLVHDLNPNRIWPAFTALDDCHNGAALQPGANCRIYVRVYTKPLDPTGVLGHSLDVEARSVNGGDQAISVSLTGTVYPARIKIVEDPDGRTYAVGSGPADWKLYAYGLTSTTRITVNGVFHPFRVLFGDPNQIAITLSAGELASPGVLNITVENGVGVSRTFRAFVYLTSGFSRAIYDPYTQQIYGFLDSTTTGGPRTFQKMNPKTGQMTVIAQLDSHYLAPQDAATAITETEGGQYLYFALGGYVHRFNLRTETVETTFTVAMLDWNWVLNCPQSILPLKDHPLDVLVWKSCGSADPYSFSVYSDGVRTGSSVLSGGNTYHYREESEDIYNFYSEGVQILRADPLNGVSTVRQIRSNLVNSNSGDFAIDGRIFAGLGVYDSDTLSSVGTLTQYGPIFNGWYYFLNPGTKLLVRGGDGFRTFNSDTYDQVDAVSLPGAFVNAAGFWKSGHNLFLTSRAQTFLFRIPADIAPSRELIPEITGVSQLFALQGSDNIQLTLHGNNFTPWSQARWNGAERETKWVDESTLKVYIPWTDLATAGTAFVSVANATGQSSPNVAFTVVAPPDTTQSALVVATLGSGTGSVTSAPSGVSCGTTCFSVFPAASTITLTATPGPMSVFAGWGGDCSGTDTCVISSANGISNVTANFQATQFKLDLAVAGTGKGRVTANFGGLDCGSICSGFIDAGTLVTITPAPTAGSTFEAWEGDCSGNGTCQVTMRAAHQVTARFRNRDGSLLRSDFDGDGKADFTVWRPSGGMWFSINSQTNFVSTQQWGAVVNGVQDVPVSGDYDGDGKTDIAVWRPSDGVWYIRPSSQPGQIIVQQWGSIIGGVPDVPVPGDYDGDGKTDIAVWRPSDGNWYIRPSSQPGQLIIQQWGAVVGGVQDIPVPGDYDGDGKTDIAVWRPSDGNWYIRSSSQPGQLIIQRWGAVVGGVQDIPVPGDYDADGKTDIAVWRPSTGTWYIIPSSTSGNIIVQQWGAIVGGAQDVPVPADYDGDRKADIAVWRPSDGNWYIRTSSQPGQLIIQQWGASGDVPAQRAKR